MVTRARLFPEPPFPLFRCKKMKLAVIGGGPSAFYVASRILKLLPSVNLRVHLFDRLWAPHGLVRYGVAPDHPEVKVGLKGIASVEPFSFLSI